MFCSTCGANVSDGDAFCPSCGAKLAQAEPQQSYPFQQPQSQQQFYSATNVNATQEVPVYDAPAPKKKSGKFKAFLASFVSLCLVFAIRAAIPYIVDEASDTVNRNAGSEASNAYEELAVAYCGYAFGISDAAGFRNSIAFDAISFTEDMVEYMCAKLDCDTSTYYAYFSDKYDENIYDTVSFFDADYRSSNKIIRNLITTEFGSTNTTFAVKKCKKMDADDLQKVYDEMNEPMVQAGLDISMYLDKDLISEAYKVNVNCVFDERVKSDEYESYDDIDIYVLNYNGEYKVLYDEMLLDMIFESWMEEDS